MLLIRKVLETLCQKKGQGSIAVVRSGKEIVDGAAMRGGNRNGCQGVDVDPTLPMSSDFRRGLRKDAQRDAMIGEGKGRHVDGTSRCRSCAKRRQEPQAEPALV